MAMILQVAYQLFLSGQRRPPTLCHETYDDSQRTETELQNIHTMSSHIVNQLTVKPLI